ERVDLVQTLRKHRGFLKHTVRELTDEQAALRPTASELSLGGLIKHVTSTERRWLAFAVGGAEAMEAEPIDWAAQFQMTEGDTLTGLLAAYEKVGAETD